MSAIDQLLSHDQCNRLPTPPVIAMRILDEVHKEEPSFRRLAAVITADPALTTRVLRIANSAIYAPVARINNLESALTRLGITTVTNIALSFILVGHFNCNENKGFNFTYFWKRAVTSAVSANLIAQKICKANDNIFITALLQDIGVLIAYLCLDDYKTIFDPEQRRQHTLKAVEQESFGFAHSQLGSEILEHWGVPEAIYQPIRYHHLSDNIPEPYDCPAHVINLADKISAVFHGRPVPEKLKVFRKILETRYHLSELSITKLIEEISEQSMQILSFFEIPSDKMKSAAEILQDANEQLSKLNLTNSQLLDQYRQEKEAAVLERQELATVNTELSRLAFEDSLTGLYNLRYFHDYFDRELQRSARYGTVFTLLMFDIDDFKAINDSHGHQAGDQVLIEIANLSRNMLRNTDVMVRYGGEEFAALLPETSLPQAHEIANRLRQEIEKLTVVWNNKKLQVTVSMGLAFYDPEQGTKNKNELIDIADKGLYQSKKAGKNRISMPQQDN
ncbi:GGDEF domain-containing protein [Desulfuromonas acetoxidans]|uniref:diguanylate cyclase n=1 Tax=Desulfuromonas acetoxidans (strain DSM 684 / 11070) TaxID=281689 RepID=Q1JYD2_DESA6|nr:GGDEF domain-containing protein [Desulfuromonas acetoxidans]EAT15274.1 diguanylate cyclase [Desulfuromonas acetoxidans DSM 684]MBF0645341.1 GGDEF domain-containing protein [Desulfuromonas acetoxidans]NVD23420.1 GGDEF domain-containing protein [Desulfuromonas acetoxidans]NVE15339.1 GGDEF domain-containing protein [Desulfuromonas acetoxidans]